MKKVEVLTLAIILIVAALLRFPLIVQGFFAFTYDQGRDLLAVRDIVTNANLTLIGPTTGIPGIFYGPWWYYFLSPIHWASGGDPLKIALVLAAIGLTTLIFLFLLIRKITGHSALSSSKGNSYIALGTAAIASMSQPFLTSSSQMWSPSLVLPLMLVYLYSLNEVFKKTKPIWFLALGLSAGFIADSGAAFGSVLILATIATSIFFKKQFFGKNYLFLFAGLLLVFLPRVIFDIRNEFLITKSIITWLFDPKIYQEKLTMGERMINRLDLFWLQFAQTFTQSKKIFSLIPILITIILAAASFTKLKKIKLFNFLILLSIFIYTIFTLYPDAVWDYYLVGLPLIFISVISLVIGQFKKDKLKLILPVLFLMIVLNFNKKLLSPFSITWQGDGAIYRNQKAVLESLQQELVDDYSLYVYTPARFDYPFDYLVDYYHRQGKIEPPKENQKRFYLIIRDDKTHSYLTSGWYGDKVKNQPTLVAQEEFSGNIIVEKHEKSN